MVFIFINEYYRMITMQLNQHKLYTLKKQLNELAELAKIESGRKYFQKYHIRSSEYNQIFKELEETLEHFPRKDKLKSLDLNIPEISEDEMQKLKSNGLYDAKLGSYLLDVQKYAERLASFIEEIIEMQVNVRAAQTLLDDAKHELNRAESLIEQRDWNGSIEASQHCIEHSIKSLFLVVGEKLDLSHDPTDNLKKVMEKLQSSNIRLHHFYLLVDIARVRWIAKIWAKVHEESMYAFFDIPAKKFFEDKDAKILKDYADEVYSTCNNFKIAIEHGTIEM